MLECEEGRGGRRMLEKRGRKQECEEGRGEEREKEAGIRGRREGKRGKETGVQGREGRGGKDKL